MLIPRRLKFRPPFKPIINDAMMFQRPRSSASTNPSTPRARSTISPTYPLARPNPEALCSSTVPFTVEWDWVDASTGTSMWVVLWMWRHTSTANALPGKVARSASGTWLTFTLVRGTSCLTWRLPTFVWKVFVLELWIIILKILI